MTPKQARFVAEYLVDLNATQAAIRAGYSAKTAGQTGFDLLKKPEIAEAIAAAQQERAQRTHITADRVLRELARVAFSDLRRLYRDDGSMLLPHEWDDDTAAAMAGVETVEQHTVEIEGGEIKRAPTFTKKVKVFDKGAALTLAMRHMGMLKDKTELTGVNGGALVVTLKKGDDTL